MPGHHINAYTNHIDACNDDYCNIEQVSSSLLSWQPTSNQQMQPRNRYSWSEASSVATSGDSDCYSTLGIGATDIDLSEIISDSRSAGYSSLLHDMSPRLDQNQVYSYTKPCDRLFYINDYHSQVYTSVYFQNSASSAAAAAREFHDGCPDSLKIVQQQTLSQDDHYSLLPTLVNQTTYFPERYPEEFVPQCDTNSLYFNNKSLCPVQTNPVLVQLSKKELIKRVIQLENERYCNTSQDFPVGQEKSDSLTNIHSCKWIGCSLFAPTLAQLMVHICEDHVGSGKATYVCEWADCIRNKKPFLKRHKMYNHMRTHTGERPFICTIPGCKKTFSRPDSLGTHIKTHSNIRPYSCTFPGCQKAYFHSRSLRKHIKSTHMSLSSARKSAPTQYK